MRQVFLASTLFVVAAGFPGLRAPGLHAAAPAQGAAPDGAAGRALLNRYCVSCHNERLNTAGLNLGVLDPNDVSDAPATWEKVVRKLRTGAMPPAGSRRPDQAASDAFASQLEQALDARAARNPNPGAPPIHRLNRAEYTNAIRDLLAVTVDGASILPADDVIDGFDNMAGVLTVSPMLMERYLAAARRISRLAVGDPTIRPSFNARVYSLAPLAFQDDRMSEDLPFGSRGGLAVPHHFPLVGTYRIKVTLRRNLYGYIRGVAEAQTLDVRVDRQRVKTFTVGGRELGRPAPLTFGGNIDAGGGTSQQWEDYRLHGDDELEVVVPLSAGEHVVSASFVRRDWEPEGVLQPPSTQFAFSVDESISSPSGRQEPAVESVAILGPYDPGGAGDTASRRRLFLCRPGSAADEEACARKILGAVARRAFRRPVGTRDLAELVKFYREGRSERDFDSGIQEALVRVLVDPEFLFRAEGRQDKGRTAGSSSLTDLELASRLSFFLWSSIPDDELLDAAEQGRLAAPAALASQVRRMLADPRAIALAQNFAGQWLELRNLAGMVPNAERFPEPDFDENLREAFQRETELFLESQIREDRPLVELLTADYTFVNERLARHYGIPDVVGSRFRRVLTSEQRGGLLGQGSILTLTSYGDRTSPVLRGKWLLDNIFGSPPPPPPPDVPALIEKSPEGRTLSGREAMEQHRSNPACASCHMRMDPLGFAMEGFDAIGRWRDRNEDGSRIDMASALPDGTRLDGVGSLRRLAISHRDDFIRTATEKMLMYALGRGLEFYDMPELRRIVATAGPDYKWSSVISGIVQSVPFRMRRSES